MCILELQPSTHVSLLYVHTQTTTIQSCIITLFVQTTGTYSFIITVCAPLDYSHPLFCQYCMCILELQPSTPVLLYLHKLQALTVSSLLYVHPRTTAIHSRTNTLHASSDYIHLFFYHHCMCILSHPFL